MNKRIKKKNNIARMNKISNKVVELFPIMFYYYLWGNQNRCSEVLLNSMYKYISYDNWVKTNSCKRCWTYIRSKHNIPKFIDYKNKTIRT